MYLIDTDVISEIRKGEKANAGVRAFFESASREELDLYLSVVSIGELRQGVERIQATAEMRSRRAFWSVGSSKCRGLTRDAILPIDEETAHVWGRLRGSKPGKPIG